MKKSILFLMMFLITACSPSGEEQNYYANQAFNRGDYARALKGYQQAQVQEPEQMRYYFNGALAYAEVGQFNQAIEAMEFALKQSDQPDADLYYNLGNFYAQTGRYSQAISAYQQGLIVDSAHEDMRYNLEAVRLFDIDNPITPAEPPPTPPDPNNDNMGEGEMPSGGNLTLEQALAILEQIERNQRSWEHFNRMPDEGAYDDGDAW